ncbi:class E sortase [Streptomyces endophyticus]|uniref:Class E sortase n=1 Tax=Streptomyces endophyticus TaxID=714166 RepID=A0ABU6F1M3_9ACTN|nr:class E sortase [Streptomyces endophyticus]MEB8337889.1 class E sortase [Streptomyces endophyticus]
MRTDRPAVVTQGPSRRSSARRVLWNGAEVAVTLGLVVLLLVVHQLWWTNRQARAGADRQVQALERQWGDGSSSGASGSSEGTEPVAGAAEPTDTPTATPSDDPSVTPDARAKPAPRPNWDQAYAVLGIPRLGLRAPVAQGISKSAVLNQGYVGHYPGTAQPGGAGNFALAGHRNTHGEPFRYINRLRRGDTLTVETKSASYTYVVDKTLAQTSAGDGGVINPVPRSGVVPGAGYQSPGYYITLTTCTPEFTSKYRLIVWGKLSAMRPR